MSGHTSNDGEFKSLTVQIRDAELQVLERRRMFIRCADTVLQKTQQQMTAPSNLLLACGIGFILSELTKSKFSESHKKTETSRATETVDISRLFTTTLNIMTSINALYTTFSNTMNKKET